MTALTIRAVTQHDLAPLFAYLDDHLRDNGHGDTPLFQPLARADSYFPVDKRAGFVAGLGGSVGLPGWRRAWIAVDTDGAICGHIDLRARLEPAAAHRCLLGIGVHRDARRQGLGARLLQTALSWAADQPALAWIDLEVLGGNHAARRLYTACGFHTTGESTDLLRIDGQQHAYVYMSKKLV